MQGMVIMKGLFQLIERKLKDTANKDLGELLVARKANNLLE